MALKIARETLAQNKKQQEYRHLPCKCGVVLRYKLPQQSPHKEPAKPDFSKDQITIRVTEGVIICPKCCTIYATSLEFSTVEG